MDENKINRLSAFWYTGFSLVLAVIFFLVTGGGKYPPMARYGGAVWIFILTMIITMPIVIPYFKKKYQ